MHLSLVRRTRFDVPQQSGFHPRYILGRSSVSCVKAGVGRYVAVLETFIAKSLRRASPRVVSMRPGYTPHVCRVPARIEKRSAPFSTLAESSN